MGVEIKEQRRLMLSKSELNKLSKLDSLDAIKLFFIAISSLIDGAKNKYEDDCEEFYISGLGIDMYKLLELSDYTFRNFKESIKHLEQVKLIRKKDDAIFFDEYGVILSPPEFMPYEE